MSQIGRRDRWGRYELTFVMDAEDCENLASCLPSRDTFAAELYELADELRAKEAARNEGPGISISIVARASAASPVSVEGGRQVTLVEFLQQRIDEDEEAGRRDFEGDESPGTWLAWVLAECAAKRAIIELHRPSTDYDANACLLCQWDTDCDTPQYGAHWPCDTLRALAAPYADHPGFRPEWRSL